MSVLVMYSNFAPSEAHIMNLNNIMSTDIFVADSEDKAVQCASEAEVIIGHRYLWQTLPYTPHVKWIQSTAAGTDHIICPELLQLKPIFTRAPIFSENIAQHAYTLAWSLIRCIPDAVMAQSKGEYAKPFKMLPAPKRVMVLGMGEIGKALARLLKRNGLEVVAVARQNKPDYEGLFDTLVLNSSWRDHLDSVDVCFITLPLTDQTRGLFNAEAIQTLPEHAVIVNVGRGAVLNTQALVSALHSGHLGGAALDVLESRPEQDDSIWHTPRLLITPKVSSISPHFQERVEAFVEQQVERYVMGSELKYLVKL